MTNKQIIEQIEELLIQLKQSLNVPSESSSHDKGKRQLIFKQGRGFSGLTGNIFELIEEGFFDEPKTISDLQKKLKDRGIKKPTTALMPSLKLLITKKVLDRNKPAKGLYNYFKR
jgi:hypothetical protein